MALTDDAGLKGALRRIEQQIALYGSPNAVDSPSAIGNPVELLNANTGGANNNRTFTVPANKIWQVQSLRVSYVTSATVGNRGLRVTYETAGGAVLYSQRTGVIQTASLTREYAFSPGAPYDTVFGGVNSDYLLVPLSPLLLKAGQVIRLRDPANISTSDSFTINGLVIEWSVA